MPAQNGGLLQTIFRFFNDPIDMAKGHFVYAHEDMTVGTGAFPYALNFQKLYSSGLRTQAGPLGQRWFGDQLIGNTVIVKQGLNGEVFVKLPDGKYNAPPGNAARLIKNADNTYSYETRHRDKLNFNTAGRIATFQHASGVQVKFTYSGNDLTQVQHSLGRTLALTYSAGRITPVSDGTRSLGFAYDANGKLYTYYFAGSRSEETGPLGLRRVAYVDAFGKVLKSIDPAGRVTTNTYDGQERLIKTVLPEGNTLTYAYDDATCAGTDKRCTHNVKTVTQVAKSGSGLASLVTSTTYESAFNRVASVTDPHGKVTTYTYTAQGLPATVTRPADSGGVQPVTTYAYTGFTPSGFATFYLPTSVTEKISATQSVVTTTTYNTSNK